MNDLVTLSPDAQPSFGSTRHFGSVSEPRPPNGCSPWVRPFPPRLPPGVASPCSVASQVLWPHPTSHPRTCSACGLSPSQAIRHGTMLPSLQRNEIGTSELDPFRSSILGRGLPCERFTSALAGRRAPLGV